MHTLALQRCDAAGESTFRRRPEGEGAIYRFFAHRCELLPKLLHLVIV